MGTLALSGRHPDFIEQYRNLTERVRRLETRKQKHTGDSVAPYSPIPLDCLGPGWTPGGDYPADLSCRFYKDRGRVYLAGGMIFYASSAGDLEPTPASPLVNCPAGYIPAFMQNQMFPCDNDNTVSSTEGIILTGEFVTGGTSWVELDQHPVLAPLGNFGYPIDGTAIFLDAISYRHA